MAKLTKYAMVFILMVGFSGYLYAADAKVKIATVDIGKVFDEYQKTKDFDKEFQKEELKKQKERDTVIDEVRRLKDEQLLLSEDKRKGFQEKIDKKLAELDQFDEKTKNYLKAKRNDSVKEIFKDIDDTLKQYGERKGYDLILNDRALLYRPASYDVTADVLNDLNKGKKGSKK